MNNNILLPETELTILGCIIRNRDLRNNLKIKLIKPKYFSSDINRKLFETVTNEEHINAEYIEIEAFSRIVFSLLSSDKGNELSKLTFDQVKEYVEELVRIGQPIKFIYSINQFIEFSMLNEFNSAMSYSCLGKNKKELIIKSYNEFEKLRLIEKQMQTNSLIDSRNRTSLMEILNDYNINEKLDNVINNPGVLIKEEVIPTGFKDIDSVIGGFRKSEYVMIGARTSMGKSSLSLCLANNICRQEDQKVLFISLEMDVESIVYRYISINTSIETRDILTGNITVKQAKNINFVKNKMIECKSFHIYDSDSIDSSCIIKYIEEKVKELGITVVIIDYLQKIDKEDTKGNIPRNYELGKISRDLQMLVKRLKILLICMGQCSRNAESRANKRPIPSDLKDSGDIEQDVDKLIFIYNRSYYERRANADNVKADNIIPEDDDDPVELIFSKNRNGKTFSTYVKHEKRFSRFSNLTKADTHLIDY